MMPQLKDINNLERNIMKNTIKLLKKQHDVLVEVIQYLDSTKQSNTKIREVVDTILNFEKKLKEDSEWEIKFAEINKEAQEQNDTWISSAS